jgi:hypothetical protein
MEDEMTVMPTAEETTKVKVGATFKDSPQLADSDYAQDLQI